MDHFGKTDEQCPSCGKPAFTYGCGIRDNGERMVATGKCRACGFSPPPVEWSKETETDAEEYGWDFLAEVYKTWSSSRS